MQVETTRFGTLDVGEEARVYFPEGLLGFGSYREYVMVPASAAGGNGGPLVWLQSCQAPELAFAVCRAEAIVRDYRLEVRAEDLAAAELASPDDATVYLIIHRDRGDLVANLRGPLVINATRRLGSQIVINDARVPLRHRIRPSQPVREPAAAQSLGRELGAERPTRRAV